MQPTRNPALRVPVKLVVWETFGAYLTYAVGQFSHLCLKSSMIISSELLSEIRQLRLALRLLAKDLEEAWRWPDDPAAQRYSITIAMFRAGADYLRDAEHQSNSVDVERYLSWMLRDFRKTVDIRKQQHALARNEPRWLLRDGASNSALETEISVYERVIIQIERIVGSEAWPHKNRRTA